MSRYIDADALIDRLDYCVKEGMGSTIAFTFKHMVEEAPSIDIVRCRECKHWHEYIDAKGQGRCDAEKQNPFRISVGTSYADFFCSYGEREGE